MSLFPLTGFGIRIIVQTTKVNISFTVYHYRILRDFLTNLYYWNQFLICRDRPRWCRDDDSWSTLYSVSRQIVQRHSGATWVQASSWKEIFRLCDWIHRAIWIWIWNPVSIFIRRVIFLCLLNSFSRKHALKCSFFMPWFFVFYFFFGVALGNSLMWSAEVKDSVDFLSFNKW